MPASQLISIPRPTPTPILPIQTLKVPKILYPKEYEYTVWTCPQPWLKPISERNYKTKNIQHEMIPFKRIEAYHFSPISFPQKKYYHGGVKWLIVYSHQQMGLESDHSYETQDKNKIMAVKKSSKTIHNAYNHTYISSGKRNQVYHALKTINLGM